MAAKVKPKPKPKATKKPKASPQPPVVEAPPTTVVLTLAEAAAFLRVSEEGLLNDTVAGRVPAKCIGGEWRFLRCGLEEWLRDHKKTEPVKSHKQIITEMIGAWKDDPTVEGMIDEIYADRKRLTVGGDEK